PILIIGDLGRVLSLGSIPLVYELGHLTLLQLYAVAFVTGVLTVFFDVSYQSYLPSLVDRDQLVEGNAKLEGSRATAQLAGPGLTLFSQIGFSVLILYSVRRLDLNPGQIGLIFAIGNVGSLLGAFSGSAVARRLGIGRTIVVSALVFGPPWLLVPLAPSSFPYPFLHGRLLVAVFGGG